MKYQISDYEETEFFGADEDLLNHKQKVVKVRKEHTCFSCQKEIPKGEQALRETGFLDEGPVSSYMCISCCDKWLNVINGEEEE